MVMDHIKEAWTKQALAYGESHEASWKDIYAIQLEIDTIGKYIKPATSVLDVGCANGYSSFQQLKHNPSKIVGVDFVDEMIFHAKEARSKFFSNHNVDFQVADIRKLPFADGSFDLVYTTRVLINLSNWQEQQQGIRECLRVARKGGVVILSEAFWEPLVKLNSLRTLAGLPSLVEHDFNRYLKTERLTEFLTKQNLNFHVEEFSSVYYLGSRFIRELIEGLENRDDYKNQVNALFFEWEKKYTNSGGFGIQQAVVIKN
jgi:ubiquinone/menaquinone biosynthesis C-methylase UbiE